jgi:NADH-quinone oxidoreductase subunit H
LQSLADGVKLALKEDIIPKAADKVVFLLAPVIAVIPAFVDVRRHPVRAGGRRAVSDRTTPLQLTDMPVAVLFVMAVASIGIYGIVLVAGPAGRRTACSGGCDPAPR